MTDLFIDYTRHPLLEELTGDYHAVEAANALTLQRVADVKQKRGQRLDHKHPDQQLVLERQRAHEVAIIRLEIDSDELMVALRKLHATRDKMEAAMSEFPSYNRMEPLVKNNLLCAAALCDAGAATYYSQARRELMTDYLARHGSAIHRLHRDPAPSADPREFVVMASGGGSRYRFDGADPNSPPPPPYLTLSEAKAEAAHWCSIADTIGGDSAIYNVRTKQDIGRWY